MDQSSRGPARPITSGCQRAPGPATFVLDRDGRILESNEMLAGFAFCRQTENRGSLFTLRVDHDSAEILKAFFENPGDTLTGKVNFCFMRGEEYYFPTILSIQALADAGAVVGFVVHVEPVPGLACLPNNQPMGS